MFYSPKQMADNYAQIAKKKTTPAFLPLLCKGILAGMFIALAAFGAHTLSAMLDNPAAAKLINALLFPSGLAMVLLVGAELFTGNCLLTLGAWKKEITLLQLLRSWGIVYLGNFIGSILIGGLSAIVRANDPAFIEVAIQCAAAKASLPWMDAFLLAVLCNILVCAAVWMSYATENTTGKIVAMYFPVVLFVLCGTEHCVANMYYFSTVIFTGSSVVTWPAFFLRNLLPVTLGNIFGGSILFSGTLYLSQFREAR